MKTIKLLVSEKVSNNIEETLFLSSIPGLVENIKQIRENENWEESDEFDPNE